MVNTGVFMGIQLTWANELINWIMHLALIDLIKWIAASSRGLEAEYLLRSTVCEYCITVCISVSPCACVKRESFGWCSDTGSSASPSSKVRRSSSERQDIYTKMPVIVIHLHTHTPRVAQYLHWQCRIERCPLKYVCPNLFLADVFFQTIAVWKY